MAVPPISSASNTSGRPVRPPIGAGRARRELFRPEGGRPLVSKRVVMARRLSAISAGLILVGGYVHLCLYRHGYRYIPKIGVSFLVQAVSSVVLATALLVRRGSLPLGRHTLALPQLTRLAAIGLSLGTLAALAIAHTPGGLFQFREIGLRPAPQTLVAIVAESLAAVLLAVAMIEARMTTYRATAARRWAWPTSGAARGAA